MRSKTIELKEGIDYSVNRHNGEDYVEPTLRVENEDLTITLHKGKDMVDAREVHKKLGVKQDFSSWVKDWIKVYELVDEVDYLHIASNKQTAGSGGHNKQDYSIIAIQALIKVSTYKTPVGRKITKQLIELFDKKQSELTEAKTQLRATKIQLIRKG